MGNRFDIQLINISFKEKTMKWYLKVVRDNYANFEGRARRQEYWMFILINILIIFGLAIIFVPIAISTEIIPLAFLPHIYALATFIPSLAVAVRRLHDTNNSGWMYCVSFIPLVGPIWLLVLLATEGDRKSNKYGPNPKLNNSFSTEEDLLDSDLLE